MNKLATILLNSLLLTFSWQQDEHAHLQVLEYNDTTLGIDLEFIASKDSNQPLGGVILKSDQKHNSSTIYENFIFTNSQQLNEQSHYIAHRLGYQVIQPYHAPSVHTLLQWLAQNSEKKIHALAFNHPICPAWHYLLTIIYPEGKIQLDEQVCDPQSLTWGLNTMIMQYLNQKVMQSENPIEGTQKILYFFSTNAENQLNDLKKENQMLRRKLRKVKEFLKQVPHPQTFIATQTLHGHTREINIVAFSPDGKQLASGGEENRVPIYDATTYKLLKVLKVLTKTTLWVRDITFSPDGKYFVQLNEEGIFIYDAKNYQLLKTLKDWDLSPKSISFSPENKLLAIDRDNSIHIYDITTYQVVKKIRVHSTEVQSVIFSHDGKLLASINRDRTIYNTINIYDATTYQLLESIKKVDSLISKLTFSFDNNHLAYIIMFKSVHIHDLNTYQLIKKIDFGKNWPRSIAFSPNGKFFAVGSLGSQSGNIYLYNATDYELFKILKGHTGSVNSLVFSPNSRSLASGSKDKSVKIWELMPFSEEN